MTGQILACKYLQYNNWSKQVMLIMYNVDHQHNDNVGYILIHKYYLFSCLDPVHMQL